MIRQAIDRFVSSLGYVKAGDVAMPVTLTGEITPGKDQPFSTYSSHQFEKLAMTNYAVYRNIMKISKMVAGGTAKVQERDSDNREKWQDVIAHPFEEIIEYRPNPWMSQSFIWMYQTAWLLLRGEAYWMLVPTKGGELHSLYPLPADRVTPIPGQTSLFSGFWYTPVNGEMPKFLRPDQICFHRFFNPFDYHRGLSPISAYLMGLKTNIEAQKTQLDDFKNKLNLQQLISLRQDTSRTSFVQAQADLREANEAGARWKVIRAGDISVASTSSPRNEFSLSAFELTESQANDIYGVPDAIWERNSTEASAHVHNQVLINDTVWPLMQMLSEDMTIQMVEPYYGNQYRAVFEDIRPVNVEQKIRQEENDRKTMTYNEAREAKGRPPHPDPDVGNAPYDAAAAIAQMKVRSPTPADEPDTAREKKADLKRWESVAKRMLKRGEQPGNYDFESPYIDDGKQSAIKAALLNATTEDEVKAAFGNDVFFPVGAKKPFSELPSAEAVSEEIQKKKFLDNTLETWDDLMPDHRGILGAEAL